MTLLGKAVAIAAAIHEAQTDKGGHAYILHPLRLMMRLRTADEELMSIAVLHDAIEDSAGEVTLDSLRALGFSSRVCDALALLTHDPKMPYESYVKAIATNDDATRVKIEDLRDNSDITRLKGIRPKDLERVAKYHKAFTYLRSVCSLNQEVGY